MTYGYSLAAGGGGSAAAGFLVLLVLFAAYWIPAAIALIRGVRNTGSIVVVNLFLGWTLIGWVVALAMACRSVRPEMMPTSAGIPPGWQPRPQPGPEGSWQQRN